MTSPTESTLTTPQTQTSSHDTKKQSWTEVISKSCTTCMDFRALRRKTKLMDETKSPSTTSSTPATIATTSTNPDNQPNKQHDTDPYTPFPCPPDTTDLGSSTWTLLHTITVTYPTHPTPTDQHHYRNLITSISYLYPCWYCRKEFREYVEKVGITCGSRDEVMKWMCDAHNEVNKRLGKPVFECDKVMERWKTGRKECFE